MLKTRICGISLGADLGEHARSPASMCSSRRGSLASTTCSSSVASRASVKRRLERRDQLVRQLADEADRVGHDHRRAARQRDPPHRRIERGEQLVGDVGIARRSARETAWTCRRWCSRPAPATAPGSRARCARPVSRCCLIFSSRLRQHLHALADEAAVGFELRFAGTAQADAALLPLEVGPAAHQAGGDVLELRELDFELAFVAARALREDVEDQRRCGRARAAR